MNPKKEEKNKISFVEDGLLNSITKLGLSHDEARTYLAALSKNIPKTDDLCEITGFDENKTKFLVAELKKKFFLCSPEKEGYICRAMSIKEVLMNQNLELISESYYSYRPGNGFRDHLNENERFILLSGRDSIDSAISSIVGKAKVGVKLCTDKRGIEQLCAHEQTLKNVSDNGVKVSVFIEGDCEKKDCLPASWDVFTGKNLTGNSCLVIDKQESIILNSTRIDPCDEISDNLGLLVIDKNIASFIESLMIQGVIKDKNEK